MTLSQTSQPMTICSWCDRVLTEGASPASHGICDDCLPRLLQTVFRTGAIASRSAFAHSNPGVPN